MSRIFQLNSGTDQLRECYRKFLLETQNDIIFNKLSFPSIKKVYDFKPDDFAEVKRISIGKCEVIHYYHIPSCKDMAIKFIRFQQKRGHHQVFGNCLRRVINEVGIHRKLAKKFPEYITEFYGVVILADHALLCMELMDMSLEDFYKNQHREKGLVKEQDLYRIARGLVGATYSCSRSKIMHRDIKPKNILLNYRLGKVRQVKLCDFGESFMMNNNAMETKAGTLLYWPPEHFIDTKTYDMRVDLWSIGITLLETIFGRQPFMPNNDLEENEWLIYATNTINDFKLQRDMNASSLAFDPEKVFLVIRNRRYFYSENIGILLSFIRYCLTPIESRPKFNKIISVCYDKHRLSASETRLLLPIIKIDKIENKKAKKSKIRAIKSTDEAEQEIQKPKLSEYEQLSQKVSTMNTEYHNLLHELNNFIAEINEKFIHSKVSIKFVDIHDDRKNRLRKLKVEITKQKDRLINEEQVIKRKIEERDKRRVEKIKLRDEHQKIKTIHAKERWLKGKLGEVKKLSEWFKNEYSVIEKILVPITSDIE